MIRRIHYWRLEAIDGCRLFGALAREFETAIVYGMPRRGAGACYISQVAVDARGEPIGFYDKLHVAPAERGFAWPGSRCRLILSITPLLTLPIE